MLGGVGAYDAVRGNDLLAALYPRRPMPVHAHDQIGDGNYRIVPEETRRSAGVRGLPVACDFHMPQVAVDARNNAQRQLARFEHRPLLDMHFNIGRQRLRHDQLCSLCNRIDIGAHICQARAQCAAVAMARARQIVLGKPPE